MTAEAAPPPPPAPAAEGPRDIGPDGEKIKDMELYDVLGVPGNASDADIKKAYRKLAVKWHPDKHAATPESSQAAQDQFVKIGEAYQILSDPQMRAAYNRDGRHSDAAQPEGGFEDPGKLFSMLFGGGKFDQWIGKISLGEDFGKAFDIAATPEEKAEMEAAKRGASSPSETAAAASVAGAAAASGPSDPVNTAAAASEAKTSPAAIDESSPAKPAPATATATAEPTSPSSVSTPNAGTGAAAAAAGGKEKPTKPGRMTEEQRKQMAEFDAERQAAKKERIAHLTKTLKDRIRPFVEAQEKGAEGNRAEEDEGTKRFEKSLREEIEDLKLESFGIELCHLIGSVYVSKSTSYLKLHRKSTSNILGLPGWWSRMKEKGTTVKEGWSFISSTFDVRSAMLDMEKKMSTNGGELPEDEMKELEQDLQGKMLLVTWRGTRFEVASILRTVVDNVLAKEPGVTERELVERAKAILLIGAMFKAVQADETDEERRELERLVASAAAKSKDKKKRSGKNLNAGPTSPKGPTPTTSPPPGPA